MVSVLNEHATLAASSNYKLASICPLSFVLPDFSLRLHLINIEPLQRNLHDCVSPGLAKRLVCS